MSDSPIQDDELARLDAAIAAQEGLRDLLPDEQIEANLAILRRKREALLVRVQDGAAVIGEGAKGVGKDGILVEGGVGRDLIKGGIVVVAKDGAQVYLTEQPEKVSTVDRQSGLGRYLEYEIANNRFLQLQGIRSGGRLVNIELDQIYISLRTTPKRAAPAEDEWLRAESALAPGEMSRMHLERPPVAESVVISVEEALAKNLHLVVLGDPGSGKTTLLRYLALIYARDLGQGRDDVQKKLLLPEMGMLPILIPLRRVSAFLQVHQPREDGTEGSALFIELLLQSLKNERIPLPADFFDPYLRSGQAVLLFDGLDEVADPDLRRRVARLVEAAIQAYPNCRCVVTSRVVGYSGSARLGGDFATTTVRDFTMEDVEHFLTHWHRLVEIGQKGAVQAALYDAERQTQALMKAIRDNERVRELAINPLMLTVIALVHRDRVKLPDRRAELYAESVDVLLGKWDEARGVSEMVILPDRPFDAGDKRLMLQDVALHIHQQQEKEISVEDLRQLLSDKFRQNISDDNELRRAVDRFLEVIEARSGLLVARGEGKFAFSHLTFQEYLAALSIAGRRDYLEYTLKVADQAWWREVILLEAGYLSTQSQERTKSLIQAVADQPSQAEPFANLVLAWECLRDVGSYRVPGNLEEELRQCLRTELETQPEQGMFASLRTRRKRGMTPEQMADRRTAAAGALAKIGGEVYWSGLYGEPEWVEIPAGKFWMGSDESSDEQPLHQVDLPAYLIARVPITNAQYALFVRESGHAPPEGWDEGRPPRGRETHPVVNVTWYDALIYCQWLGQVTNKSITLPSEAEWEKAARGSGDQRAYPWGETFEATRCNCAELGLRDTTPVGIFPGGASPDGVLEMSGNVWEWTRSLGGDYPYPKQGRQKAKRENLEAVGSRVLRGGAFLSSRGVVRCAFRLGYPPDYRLNDFGFRVVVSPFDSGL